MVCYYHNDIDGKASGFLVHKLKPKMIEDRPQNYYPVSYDSKFDKHTIKDDVVIVDYSISEETYLMLVQICKTARTVTWIDHHKTSLEVVDRHLDQIQAIRNLTYFVSDCASGTALTYIYFNIPKDELQNIRSTSIDEYYKIDAEFEINQDNNIETKSDIRVLMSRFNKNETNPSIYTYQITLPRWVAAIDDYDCWKGIYDDTKYIFLGLESKYIELTSQEGDSFNTFWEELYSNRDDTVNNVIQSGQTIKQYLDMRYSRELSDTFEWEFDGTRFLCKNNTGNSWNFGEKIAKYKAVILYHYAASVGKWKYSVYSSDSSSFDCAAFCKQFGGGGHLHAAGFSTEHDIFTTQARDIQPATICMNGLVSLRDEFKESIKAHSLTKNKRTRCFSAVNKASRKVFQDYEIDVDYKGRKEIPKIDLIITSMSSVKRPENIKNFYKIVTDILDNKHGRVFLAIIMDEPDSMGNIRPLESEDTTDINLAKIAKMVKASDGIVRYFDNDDPIKSIANEVSYII